MPKNECLFNVSNVLHIKTVTSYKNVRKKWRTVLKRMRQIYESNKKMIDNEVTKRNRGKNYFYLEF